MANDIKTWLAEIGLTQYTDTFVENAIDYELLPQLSDSDLKELGIVKLGDRKRLLLAIEQLAPKNEVQPEIPTTSAQQAGSVAQAEFRQLTVMFADLVGSTAMSTRLDAEVYRDLIRTYQDGCAEVVARYDGYIAKYMGDGVLVYFGWPIAHEDDAERAIHVGLELIEAVSAFDGGEAGQLTVRIGIATGRVVVGDIIGQRASQEAAIAGEAPNLAARLQTVASPNEIVIAQSTFEIAGALFDCVDLGAQSLKGFDDPINAWRVMNSRTIDSRFAAMRKQMLTPLVGRDEEIGILKRRWQHVCSGKGQVVMLTGEPGIGKSRIVDALEEHLETQSYALQRYQCSPYHSNSALYPVIGQIERTAGFRPDDCADEKLAKLEAHIEKAGRSNDEMIPLIAPLLSIPMGNRYAPINVSPPLRKRLTLQALVELFRGQAEQSSVLFHFEDAHWIDPTSREFLDQIIAATSDTTALIIVSYRAGFSSSRVGENHVTLMSLSRLDASASIELAGLIGINGNLSSSVIEEIAERAGGLPLFVEEVTRSVMQTAVPTKGVRAGSKRVAIPASIEDSLMARLDHLGPVKEVALAASVIGRTFRQDVLASVMEMEASSIEASLDELVKAGIVQRRTSVGELSFEFKHALVQEVAYQSILKTRRQYFHKHIAAGLVADTTIVEEPEVIAHHHTEAGATESAIEWWLKACQAQLLRSAYVEAESILRRGIELLDQHTDPTLRDRQEIALRNLLGVCMMPTRGFGNPEVAAEFSRSAALAEHLDDARGLFIALRGKGQYNMVSGNNKIACDDTYRILGLAEKIGDHDFQVEAHHLGWSALCFNGNFKTAYHHALAGISSYDRDRDHHLTYTYSGHDPGVCCRAFGSLSCAHLGSPDQAIAMIDEGMALSEELQHPFTTGIALWAKGILHHLRGEMELTHQTGERVIRYTHETGLPPMAPIGKVFQGDALLGQGEYHDGIVLMREGIAECTSFGTVSTVSGFFPPLANALGKVGKTEEGLALIDEGLAAANAGGDRFKLSDMFRVRASLLLAQSAENRKEAEITYRSAIDCARVQNSLLLEIKAANDLAKLLGESGKRPAAVKVLAPTYNAFNEGFELTVLKEAKTLLDTLV